MDTEEAIKSTVERIIIRLVLDGHDVSDETKEIILSHVTTLVHMERVSMGLTMTENLVKRFEARI